MSEPTPKEAIANLNHIYGIFAPDIQRSLDVAIKALERPKGEWKCTVHSTYRGYYKDGEPVWGSSKVYSCPICGRRTIVKENFCPNCGADMRGDKQ